jgi:hypothetical protein
VRPAAGAVADVVGGLASLVLGGFAAPFVKIGPDARARVRAAWVFGSPRGIVEGVDS